MFRKLSEGIFGFFPLGNSSNIYLLKGKENTLIDAGLGIDSPLLEESLIAIGVKPSGIAHIFFTHGHCDHISGASLFPNAGKWMSRHDGERVNSKDSQFTFSSAFHEDFFPKINNFYEKNHLLEIPPFSIEIIETPGHTKGSVCLYERKMKILFSGDTIFGGAVGRYDLPSGNPRELKGSIEKISSLDFDSLLPGHGEPLKGGQKKNIEDCLAML